MYTGAGGRDVLESRVINVSIPKPFHLKRYHHHFILEIRQASIFPLFIPCQTWRYSGVPKIFEISPVCSYLLHFHQPVYRNTTCAQHQNNNIHKNMYLFISYIHLSNWLPGFSYTTQNRGEETHPNDYLYSYIDFLLQLGGRQPDTVFPGTTKCFYTNRPPLLNVFLKTCTESSVYICRTLSFRDVPVVLTDIFQQSLHVIHLSTQSRFQHQETPSLSCHPHALFLTRICFQHHTGTQRLKDLTIIKQSAELVSISAWSLKLSSAKSNIRRHFSPGWYSSFLSKDNDPPWRKPIR